MAAAESAGTGLSRDLPQRRHRRPAGGRHLGRRPNEEIRVFPHLRPVVFADARHGAPGLASLAMSLLSPQPSLANSDPDSRLDERAYVTDGTRLFRVVQPINPPRAVTSAVLEDCRTLDLHSFTAANLWEMGLRAVRPSAELPG
jgi:hypothetical protein